MSLTARPFYFDDGNGHGLIIRRWLPYGHPGRTTADSHKAKANVKPIPRGTK